MLDPRIYDFLEKVAREIVRVFPSANVCKRCALGMLCTTAVFLTLILAKVLSVSDSSDSSDCLAVFVGWFAANLVCAGLCKGDTPPSGPG